MNEKRIKDLQESYMAHETSDELVQILITRNLEPEALEAAKLELEKRGIDPNIPSEKKSDDIIMNDHLLECKVCRKLIDTDSLFCSYCGSENPFEAYPSPSCPKCGSSINTDAQFCKKCGYKFDTPQSSNYIAKPTKNKKTTEISKSSSLKTNDQKKRQWSSVFLILGSLVFVFLFTLFSGVMAYAIDPYGDKIGRQLGFGVSLILLFIYLAKNPMKRLDSSKIDTRKASISLLIFIGVSIGFFLIQALRSNLKFSEPNWASLNYIVETNHDEIQAVLSNQESTRIYGATSGILKPGANDFYDASINGGHHLLNTTYETLEITLSSSDFIPSLIVVIDGQIIFSNSYSAYHNENSNTWEINVPRICHKRHVSLELLVGSYGGGYGEYELDIVNRDTSKYSSFLTADICDLIYTESRTFLSSTIQDLPRKEFRADYIEIVEELEDRFRPAIKNSSTDVNDNPVVTTESSEDSSSTSSDSMNTIVSIEKGFMDRATETDFLDVGESHRYFFRARSSGGYYKIKFVLTALSGNLDPRITVIYDDLIHDTSDYVSDSYSFDDDESALMAIVPPGEGSDYWYCLDRGKVKEFDFEIIIEDTSGYGSGTYEFTHAILGSSANADDCLIIIPVE